MSVAEIIHDTIFTAKVEQNAILSAPVYEKHVRSKNWLAKIHLDPKSPSGIGRAFCERAKGEAYYFINGLKVGDPIEFGGDYYSSSNNVHRHRWYGVVTKISEEFQAKKCKDAREACELALQLKQQANPLLALEAEHQKLLSRLAEIEKEIENVK